MIYIFKKHRHAYVVLADSEEDAWKLLAKRQSMSIKTCKQQYTFLDYVHENSNIKKIGL